VKGRPTTFGSGVQEDAWAYIDNFNTVHGHQIPSVVGLCKVIKRAKSTIYDWAKRDDNEFSDILEAINEAQQLELINKGLSGDFNSNIAKLVLGKHGFHDKQDVSGSLAISHDQWIDQLED
jgi:hypothetical protein